MSSIVAGMNAERTNRWLLIGAALFAVLTGILVFALLANFGDNSNGSNTRAPVAGANVLVASRDIKPGEEITKGMFTQEKADTLIAGYADDENAVIGQTASQEILQGSQLSHRFFVNGISNQKLREQMAFILPDNTRGYALRISEETAVGGFIVPGDRIDLIVKYTDKRAASDQERRLHVLVLAENVLVMARGQEDQNAVGSSGSSGKGPNDGVNVRPDVSADPGATTLTLALTPEQIINLTKSLFLDDAEVFTALRKFGDGGKFSAPSVDQPVFN